MFLGRLGLPHHSGPHRFLDAHVLQVHNPAAPSGAWRDDSGRGQTMPGDAIYSMPHAVSLHAPATSSRSDDVHMLAVPNLWISRYKMRLCRDQRYSGLSLHTAFDVDREDVQSNEI